MPTDANPPARPGLPSWIWIAAAVVVVLLVAGGGYWFLKGSHKTNMAANRPKLAGLLGDTVTELDNTMPDQSRLCDVSLKRAMDFGAAPAGSTLVSQDAQAAQPEGTYTCQAQTSDGKYTLTITTICPGSQDKTCYALNSVQREDGQFTYHRQS